MTGQELVELYKSGKRDFTEADLTGANLFEANLSWANLTGANLFGADLTGADLTGAYLSWANLTGAKLSWANLSWANLFEADLTGAYLTGADLTGAYLTGANLSWANLTGAKLSWADLRDQWIIQGPVRSDGYCFFLQKLTEDKAPMIKAGCRYFTVDKAREHWTKTLAGTPLGNETFAILDYLEAVANIRGLIVVPKTESAS